MPNRRAIRWLIAVPVAVVAALIVVVLCAVVALVIQGKAAPGGNGEYVALGSSFGAGPGITVQARNSPVLCDRSADNYAHLVARAERLNLSDMTCSGAVSADLLVGGQYFQGPQLRAVKPSTKLVTITVGGNDVYYLGNLFAWSCARQPAAVPLAYRLAGVCTPHPDRAVAEAFASLPGDLTRIATRIHAIAPKARVVFVDYTAVLPSHGTCAALPITPAQADRARSVAHRLERVTAEVAQRSDSILVRASALTAGHDVCSSDPWVFGFQWGSSPLAHSILPFHPREAAMKRIAAAVERAIR